MIFPLFRLNVENNKEYFSGGLSVPHDNVMDMNNIVAPWALREV